MVRRATSHTEVGTTAWSPDGLRLLYATMPHPRPDPDAEADVFGDHPTYRVYDFTTGKTVVVHLPGVYAAWLGTGEIVVVGPSKLVAVRAGASRPLTHAPFRYSHVSVSDDGKSLVALALRIGRGPDQTTERIVAVDPSSEEVTELTAETGFAEQRSPALAPRTKRLAYIRTTHLANGHTTRALVVGGRPITSAAPELVGFSWIDEESIVLDRTDGLVVIRADTGEVRRPPDR